MMRRVLAWDAALIDWARSVLGRDFVWGKTDCATLARGAIMAMYEGAESKVSMGPLPGWTTERGAVRAHVRTGGPVAVLRRMGAERVCPAYAQRGDITVDDSRALPNIGIVVSGGVVMAHPDRGVFLVPLPARDVDLLVLRLPYG